jgi:tRNA A-37 threonylcarbamoyl transferase component Bud32
MTNIYVKQGVEMHEYKMHEYVYYLNIVNVPKIISYNKTKKELVMEKITGSNLSDFYGEDAYNIPVYVFEQVREIIAMLTINNIMYIDITGYNFMLDKNYKLWIIDFEHATLKTEVIPDFITTFLRGANEWNEEFR